MSETFDGDYVIASDENQNLVALRLKKEIDDSDSYRCELESIISYTKQIQPSGNLDLALSQDMVIQDIKQELNLLNSEQTEIFVDLNKNMVCENSNQSESDFDTSIPLGGVELTAIKHCPTESKKSFKHSVQSNENSEQEDVEKTFGESSDCDNIAIKNTILKHSKSKSRKCLFCNFISTSASILKVHRIQHSKEKLLQCPHCSYKTVLTGHMNRHINWVHASSPSHTCRFCHFLASDFKKLREHTEMEHKKIVLLGGIDSCNKPKLECLNQFKTRSKAFVRGKRCTGEKLFQCQYCDYCTPFSDYLNIHINSRHTQNIMFKCQHCEYQATKLYTLRCHINSKHTKQVLYKCKLCNMETTRSNILKRHIERIHVVKSFKCDHCEYIAKKEGHLRKHLTRKHKIHIKVREDQTSVKIE